MKTSILTIVIICLGYVGYSQKSWAVIEKNEQFSISVTEIEYKNESDGINHQRLVFRYENYTSAPIILNFNREVMYLNQSIRQDPDFTISIPASSVIEYDESKKYDKTYYIFKKDNNNTIKKSLSDFKIINLRIN